MNENRDRIRVGPTRFAPAHASGDMFADARLGAGITPYQGSFKDGCPSTANLYPVEAHRAEETRADRGIGLVGAALAAGAAGSVIGTQSGVRNAVQ